MSMNLLSDNSQKLPFAESLAKFGDAKSADTTAMLGKGLPCTVSKVIGPGIVEVNFEVSSSPATLPKVIMPVAKPPYIQYPIQIGDIGVALSADLRLGGLTGLGSGIPNLQDTPANLAAMTFIWLGKTSEEFLNSSAVSLIEPSGNCNLQVAPTGTEIDGPNGNMAVSGNITAGTGITASFTTPTGQTVMVVGGIIVGLY